MTDAMAERRRLTLKEFGDEARARFGPVAAMWAFQCPMCGDVATAADYPPEMAAAVSMDCVGRYRGAVGADGDGKPTNAERGCSYSAHGLVPGPWEIVMPAGGSLHCFPLAPAPETASADAAVDCVDTVPTDQADDADGDRGQASVADTPTSGSAYWAVWSGDPLVLTVLHEFDTVFTADEARAQIEKYDEPDNPQGVPWKTASPYILEALTGPRLRILLRLEKGNQPVAWDDHHGYAAAERGVGCRHCGTDASAHPGYAV